MNILKYPFFLFYLFSSAVFANKLHHKKVNKDNIVKIINIDNSNLSFDFDYSGNVLNILTELKKTIPNIKIFAPIGLVKNNININLSLQNVTIKDLREVLLGQTNGVVDIKYDKNSNIIRLYFTDKLDVGKDAILESIKWQQGGSPKPILKKDGVVRFPYGEYQPIVICQPTNLCDIELQANEEIQGIVIGDSVHWNDGDSGIPIVYSGTGKNITPHLVLKPNSANLETSLMVTTSKRTYMIKLKSSNTNFLARAGFYYPGEMVQKYEINKFKKNTSNNGGLPLININNLNYRYSLSDKDFDWKPLQVFDDGLSVFIQFPDSVATRNLPAICILDETSDEKCEMVNFRFNDHYYVVDKLFRKAKLVNGFGDKAQVITVSLNEEHKSFWSKLFGKK